MNKDKIYSYQRIKKQFNCNISKRVLEEMDKERLDVDLDNIFSYPLSRSEFVHRALINYIIELRLNKQKLKEKKE